jgi:hypothetical protein
LTPSYELPLMALAVLLYAYDCAVLLYADEGLLIAGAAAPCNPVGTSDPAFVLDAWVDAVAVLAPCVATAALDAQIRRLRGLRSGAPGADA